MLLADLGKKNHDEWRERSGVSGQKVDQQKKGGEKMRKMERRNSQYRQKVEKWKYVDGSLLRKEVE